MAEKKDNAPVDETEDDIDIDLDYLLEEGLEATEKEEKEKKKKASKRMPVRKAARKENAAEVKTPAKKKVSVKKEPSKIRAAPKKQSEAGEDKKSAQKKPKESSLKDKEVKSPSKSKREKEPSEDVLLVEDEDEGKYVAKLKPDLPEGLHSAMRQRAYLKRRKPDFRRQEWFRYKRLGTAWRRPRGLHSKLRRHLKYRINVVSIGYGTNRLVRGLHPSGFKEVLVYRPQDLEEMDPTLQAARIGHSVGSRKREIIEKRARELGIRVLNRSG